MGKKHARFGQPKAPNKTHTPLHRKEMLQQQRNIVFFLQKKDERARLKKALNQEKNALEKIGAETKKLPDTYIESNGANEERLADAQFVSAISDSLPKPSFISRSRFQQKDKNMLINNQKILKGAYLLILKKIKAEYDNASMFVKAAALFSSSVNSVENSKLFCLIRDGLGGKGTFLSNEDQIEWLQALKEHMANSHVQQQLQKAVVEDMSDLVEEQLAELQPSIAATI